MKLFEKPWLEIININLNDIVVTSPDDTNVGEIPSEEMPGEGSNGE